MDHFHRSNENTGSSNLLFAHAKIWSPAIVIAAISLRPPYAPQLWICVLQVMNPKHTNCPYKILAAIRPIDFLSILFTNWGLTAACGSHQDVRRKFLGLRNETIGARPSQTFFFLFFFFRSEVIFYWIDPYASAVFSLQQKMFCLQAQL